MCVVWDLVKRNEPCCSWSPQRRGGPERSALTKADNQQSRVLGLSGERNWNIGGCSRVECGGGAIKWRESNKE